MNERQKLAAKRLAAFFGDGPKEDLSPEVAAALEKLEALVTTLPSTETASDLTAEDVREFHEKHGRPG